MRISFSNWPSLFVFEKCVQTLKYLQKNGYDGRMPKVKGTKPGEFEECICAFAERLGEQKQMVIASTNALIALLTLAKAYLKLFNFTVQDEIDKVKLQAELAWLESGTERFLMLPKSIQGFIRNWADCPPVATYSKTLKKTFDDELAPIYERQFEIQRLIDAIDKKNRKESIIQGWIDYLQAFVEAVESCGES
jgi:hypothetical protein